MRKRLVATTAGLCLGGCATIFADGVKQLPVDSFPAGAQVLVDGQPVGSTPGTVPIKGDEDHWISIRLPGYVDNGCLVTSSVGAGWVILDIFVGLVPLLIDAITEDWASPDQGNCRVRLVPVATAPVPAAGPTGIPAAAPVPKSGSSLPVTTAPF